MFPWMKKEMFSRIEAQLTIAPDYNIQEITNFTCIYKWSPQNPAMKVWSIVQKTKLNDGKQMKGRSAIAKQ